MGLLLTDVYNNLKTLAIPPDKQSEFSQIKEKNSVTETHIICIQSFFKEIWINPKQMENWE